MKSNISLVSEQPEFTLIDYHKRQGSHSDWKSWKMKMDMEKSWNMRNWQKVMEFSDQSWNFTNFAFEFLICTREIVMEN